MSDLSRPQPSLPESIAAMMRCISARSPCVVVLLGPPGAGKSTLSMVLAQQLGNGTAVLSYAAYRAEVSGDPAAPAADPTAGARLRERLADRCAAGLTTIVDGTHHLARSRAALLAIAADAPVTSRRMDRIAIIGCGGSGKTHLANQLAALLNLPLTHLDGIYYDADWNPLPQDEFADLQRKLVAEPRWLLEGNYAGTLPIRLAEADTVIFLDLHAIACLTGILQRRWRYRGGQHTKDGVYDRITWNFVRYIWGYRETMRPKVRRVLEEPGGNVRLITLTSRRQAAAFVAQLRAETSSRN